MKIRKLGNNVFISSLLLNGIGAIIIKEANAGDLKRRGFNQAGNGMAADSGSNSFSTGTGLYIIVGLTVAVIFSCALIFICFVRSRGDTLRETIERIPGSSKARRKQKEKMNGMGSAVALTSMANGTTNNENAQSRKHSTPLNSNTISDRPAFDMLSLPQEPTREVSRGETGTANMSSGSATLRTITSTDKSSGIIDTTSLSLSISMKGTTTDVSKELGLSVPAYLQYDASQDFRMKQLLTKGGFGNVYLADAFHSHLCEFGSMVVVKESKKDKDKWQEKDKQLFLQEVALMEYFKKHKNIAKLLGFTMNPFCIIMKCYKMGNLMQWLKRQKKIDLNYRVPFAQDVANAILALNQKGVVHNDIKPENILLDIDETSNQPFCVLTDFGICHIVSPQILKVRQFAVTEIKGLSMTYAAPERIMKFRGYITLDDPREVITWDVFAFGVTLYQILNISKSRNEYKKYFAA